MKDNSALLKLKELDILLEQALTIDKTQKENFCFEAQDDLNRIWNTYKQNFLSIYEHEILTFYRFSERTLWAIGSYLLAEIHYRLPWAIPKEDVYRIEEIRHTKRNRSLVKKFQQMQYDYNFTVCDVGVIAELLLVTTNLSINQFLLILDKFLDIGRYNFFKSYDEFFDFRFHINEAIGMAYLNR